MALPSLRLRRNLTLSASLLNHCRPFSGVPSSSSPTLQNLLSPSNVKNSKPSFPPHFRIQSLSFRSSLSAGVRRIDDADKISPDTILFEGCDYNHWLITMDFPKDPKPTPEEMVETYVQTLAKVVGSVEEAKKRMYACSTTTYTGFQAVMSEEMSEKFRGLPGVVFILPDSYIDPVNKEYGGDKYDNGVITPRPPPVQYGRNRPRNSDRPRYERPREQMPMRQGNPQYDRPMHQGNSSYDRPMHQGNPPYNHQSSVPGYGRNYAPQQNYGPAGQGDQRGYGPPQGERRDFGQAGGTGPMPPYQEYNQGNIGNYASQERTDFRGDYRNSGPPSNGNYRQASSSGYEPRYPGPGEGQRFQQGEHTDGMQGDERSFNSASQGQY